MSSLHDPELEAEHLRRLAQHRVDGLLVSVTDERNPETVDLLSRAGVPIVLIDRELPATRAGELASCRTTARGCAPPSSHLAGARAPATSA